jgi:hypothetical protein
MRAPRSDPPARPSAALREQQHLLNLKPTLASRSRGLEVGRARASTRARVKVGVEQRDLRRDTQLRGAQPERRDAVPRSAASSLSNSTSFVANTSASVA